MAQVNLGSAGFLAALEADAETVAGAGGIERRHPFRQHQLHRGADLGAVLGPVGLDHAGLGVLARDQQAVTLHELAHLGPERIRLGLHHQPAVAPLAFEAHVGSGIGNHGRCLSRGVLFIADEFGVGRCRARARNRAVLARRQTRQVGGDFQRRQPARSLVIDLALLLDLLKNLAAADREADEQENRKSDQSVLEHRQSTPYLCDKPFFMSSPPPPAAPGARSRDASPPAA